jgi:hypothetical protein
VAERGLLVASPKQRLRSTLRFSLAECSIIACEQAGYTEPLMANEVLINLLGWCKRERENLQCQLDALKAGDLKHILMMEVDGRIQRRTASSA